MIRFLLNAILALFVLRVVFWVARLLTAGSRREDARGRVRDAGAAAPEGGTAMPNAAAGRAGSRARVRVDRSAATDVPFTELPPSESRPGDC